MAVYLYDDALLTKLRAWTENTQLKIYSPDDTNRLFEVIADATNDQSIKLPIICLTRNGGYTVTNINKRPLVYDGLTLDATEDSSVQLNAIPIKIQYQLDVYTKYLKEADTYVRDLIFNFINYPTLYVTLPYNGKNIQHNANVRISENIDDNSNIPERLIQGQFTRMSLMLDIDDAYLWDVRERDNVIIGGESCIDIYKDTNSDDYVREELNID